MTAMSCSCSRRFCNNYYVPYVLQVQYVALRNINLIIQKRPDILKHEMKVFFVKYNDPIYIKLEKLDIMIRLTSQANIAQVLSELKVRGLGTHYSEVKSWYEAVFRIRSQFFRRSGSGL